MLVPRVRRHPDLLLASALLLATLALYVRALAPSVLPDDSGEWQYMVNVLGVPHSTGYPLFVLLGKLFTLLPLGNPAYRVSLFAAILSALAIPALYVTARQAIGKRAPAFLAAGLAAVAPMLWDPEVQARVYGLNALLGILVILFALRWSANGNPRDLYLMAFTFGLALTNHRSAAFVAGGIAASLWFRRRDLTLRRAAVAGLLLLLPLSLYIYIPIRAAQLLAQQDPANWALYPRQEAILKGLVSARYTPSLQGFLTLVLAFDKVDAIGVKTGLAERVANVVGLWSEQFTPVGLVLGLAGIAWGLRRAFRPALILALSGLGVAAIAFSFNAVTARFYFMIAYCAFAIFAGWAIYAVYEVTHTRFRAGALVYVAAAAGLLALLAFNLPRLDASQDRRYEQFAQQILSDSLAPNAVVIAPWEIATPIRYLQFVEGERPDVLVIHESPVRPQFQKLLDSAHQLHRPFYYVQFTPEDQNATGPRTVQAVGMPLVMRPEPEYQVQGNIVPAVRVLGYTVSPDPARPGDLLRVSVFYQTSAPPNGQFSSELEIDSLDGQTLGSWRHIAVSPYYRTYFWQAGEWYRDVWDIPLAKDERPGLYNASLIWYPSEPETGLVHEDRAQNLSLGAIRLGDFDAGIPSHPLAAEFSNGMLLRGYDLVPEGAAAPGNPITVRLYWQATRRIAGQYTVFVHLEDDAGVLRAQSDRAPWGGRFPTDHWTVGETVRDEYTLKLPASAAAGPYRLRVGLYQTADRRVPLVSGGDQVTIELPSARQ